MNTFDIKNLIARVPREYLNFRDTSILKEAAFFGNMHGEAIRPSLERISKQVKCSLRTVKRAFRSLVGKEFLIITYKPKRGCWTPVEYKLNIKLLRKISIVNVAEIENKPYKNEGHFDTAYNYRGDNVSLSSDKNANIQCHSDTQSTNTSTNDLLEETRTHEGEPIHETVKPTSPKQEKNLVPKQNKRLAIDQDMMEKIVIVFIYWKEILNHPRCFLDEATQKHIANALRWGYSVEELKQAILGMSKTPHNMGDNPNKQIYDGIHTVFKNSLQIDRFMRTGVVKKLTVDPAIEKMRKNLEGCI